MKKGFTLVELSIVLVIIGLLIGGILVAQSMVSTAKISAQVSQISQFDAGVMNFRTKYNALPGDAKAFGGNENDAIEGYPNNHVGLFSYEIASFWNNVFPNEYTAMGVNYMGYQAVSSGANKNVVLSKMGEKNSFFIASALSDGSNAANLIDKKNYYGILDASQAQSIYGGSYQFRYTDTYASSNKGSPVRNADLLSLDVKMDNGLPDTGIVLSGRLPNNGGVGGLSVPGLTACSTSGKYVTTSNDPNCTPLIRIGSSVGNPL